MLLLAECFPPFRRQYPRFLFFCSFKHASFGSSSPAVLSFLRQKVGGGERNLVESLQLHPTSWTNRAGNPPESVQIDQRRDKKNNETKPDQHQPVDGGTGGCGGSREKLNNKVSEGIWERASRGGGVREVSHSPTHRSWCSARADGPSLASGSDCTITETGGVRLLPIVLLVKC